MRFTVTVVVFMVGADFAFAQPIAGDQRVPMPIAIPSTLPEGIHTIIVPATVGDGSQTLVVAVSGGDSSVMDPGGEVASAASSLRDGQVRSITRRQPITPTTSSTSSETSSSTSSASTEETARQEKAMNTGAIVGGVVGGLALICIAVVVIHWVRRRHPRTTARSAQDQGGQVMKPLEYRRYSAVPDTSFERPQELQGTKLYELPEKHV